MKKLKHFVEYLFVRLFDLFFSVLPESLAFSWGEKLGVLFSKILYKRHLLILDNLTKAFPEKSEEERQKIALGVWKNLGRTAIEFIRLPRITKENFRDYFVYDQDQYVEDALKDGKGLIFVTFHFSNWEMSGIGHQFNRNDVVAIARPMKNPFVERWVQNKRKACGMDIILHRQAVRASLKILKNNKSIGILVDQNLYEGGVFVDFFGRPAATTTLPALLHTRTGAPIIVGYSLRENGKYRLMYEKRVTFPDVPKGEDQITFYTQYLSHRIEEIIRRYPENWFWIHNRWKRKPVAPAAH